MSIASSKSEDKAPTRNLYIVLFATSLAIISMIGIDIYVPALDEIQSDFNTTAAMVGISMPAFFAGTFATQLIYGPISDVVGRKPVLLVGLCLFLLGTVACLVAGSIELFLAGRFVQAFGVCSTAVLWQPIVTDTYPDDEVRVKAIFGIVMSFIGISPALAPLLGGWITEILGWRAVFIVLFALAAALLLFSMVAFSETLDETRKRSAHPRGIVSSLKELASAPVFYIYAGAVGLTVGAYMSYLTIAPFSLSALGYSPLQIGVHFIPLAMLFGLGGAAGKIAGGRLSEVGLLRLGGVIMLGAGILFYVTLNTASVQSIFDYLVPFGILTFSFGIVIPTGSAMAIHHFRKISGACSSGMNFTTSLAAFASTLIASLLYAGHLFNAMTMIIVVNSAFVLLFLLLLKEEPAAE